MNEMVRNTNRGMMVGPREGIIDSYVREAIVSMSARPSKTTEKGIYLLALACFPIVKRQWKYEHLTEAGIDV